MELPPHPLAHQKDIPAELQFPHPMAIWLAWAPEKRGEGLAYRALALEKASSMSCFRRFSISVRPF